MRSEFHLQGSILLLAIATLLSLTSFVHGQELAKRLILKDGSYQPAIKWEIHGDRVHYLSAERNEWEDVPSSLVDWDATKKFEADLAAGHPSRTAAEIDKEVEEERKVEEAKTPLVAPGLRLSEDGGVMLLDTFQGQPQLDEIQQSGGQINKNMKGNIFRSTINPIASAKQAIELEGAHAKVQAHATQPTFFISLEDTSEISPDQPQKTASAEKPSDPMRFHIVRADTKQDKRIVGNIKIAVYGKVSQQEKVISSKSEMLPGSKWVKLTPSEPLSPGEYAVVEMLSDQSMNLYVWDFGVNPSAPANPNAWKPDPRILEQSQTPAELQKR